MNEMTDFQTSLLFRSLNTERNLIIKELEKSNNNYKFVDQITAINELMLIFGLETMEEQEGHYYQPILRV